MQRHHTNRRTLRRRHGGNERIRGAPEHPEGVVARLHQLRTGIERNASLEHRRVIGGLAAREREIGFAEAIEGRERIGPAVAPRLLERGLELLEATQRNAGQKLITIAKVAIGRRRTDPRPARGFRKGEARGALLGNQLERGADQRLLEIAVVVAARAPSPTVVLRPAHVKSIYIVRGESSIGRRYGWFARIAVRSASGMRRARPPETKATCTRASINTSSPRITR